MNLKFQALESMEVKMEDLESLFDLLYSSQISELWMFLPSIYPSSGCHSTLNPVNRQLVSGWPFEHMII